MKKIIVLIITATLLLTSTSTAFAKTKHEEEKNKHQITHQENKTIKEKKQDFKIDGSPVIKYDRYKLPIRPVEKGMGAKVHYEKSTAVLTVTKGTITIVIDFKNKTVTVNGSPVTNSGIFTASNSKKTTVLIKYIAAALGMRVDIDDDEVSVVVPGLDFPTNVTVTPYGTTNVANSLNSTTLYLQATANIVKNQAIGGRAELYVGSKLVATDSSISAEETTVTFTTYDGTPTNAELQALVPKGGVVTVRLYNSSNQYVTSTVGNPTLTVDYAAPTITGINSAAYSAAGGRLNLNVTGAGGVGDTIDVTKITIHESVYNRIYTLTNASGTGSYGVVKNANLIQIDLGSVDRLGIAGLGNTVMYLTVAAGNLISDAAGNPPAYFAGNLYVPMTAADNNILDLPRNVTVTVYGGTVLANTLNLTNTHLFATANITPGQATGGHAELLVGSKLVAVDNEITAADNAVSFTTSDGTPVNAELLTAVPLGGVVTVKLYNAYGYSVVSTVGNPTLVVDYVAPTLTGITSAIYNMTSKQLYLNVTGAGAVGDIVDVTRILLHDPVLGYYQLTNNTGTGSSGTVISSNTLLISLGSADRNALKDFGNTTMTVTVTAGSLIKDAAGNTSPLLPIVQDLTVSILK